MTRFPPSSLSRKARTVSFAHGGHSCHDAQPRALRSPNHKFYHHTNQTTPNPHHATVKISRYRPFRVHRQPHTTLPLGATCNRVVQTERQVSRNTCTLTPRHTTPRYTLPTVYVRTYTKTRRQLTSPATGPWGSPQVGAASQSRGHSRSGVPDCSRHLHPKPHSPRCAIPVLLLRQLS